MLRVYAKDRVDQIDRVFTSSGGVIFIRNKTTGRVVVIDNNEDFDKLKHNFQSFTFYLHVMLDPFLTLV